jgi:hypothetical protein
MFIKLLVYFYTMIQLPINCILMALITIFLKMFEARINYMWILKKFKVSESYMFILYVVPIFPKIVYTIMGFHPLGHFHHMMPSCTCFHCDLALVFKTIIIHDKREV